MGGGGNILKYPPQKNLPKMPPSKFWEIFLKNRKNEEN